MNCLEFESQVEILARGRLADARTRAAAEAHGESCETCAARLADERSLSSGLRALAAGMKTAEASARVEASLLAAFRARSAASAAAESSEAAAATNVISMSGHAPVRRWSWAKTIAVASMAAAASLALFVLVGQDTRRQAPVQRAMIEPPPNTSGGPPTIVRNEPLGSTGEGVEPQQPTPEVSRAVSPRPSYALRVRAVPAAYTTSREYSRPAQAAAAQEVATDFIPLSHAGPYTQNEDSHLVRIEMPRSALASFGLPVNAEAAGGNVKADVLMGQDGIARAIRFIR